MTSALQPVNYHPAQDNIDAHMSTHQRFILDNILKDSDTARSSTFSVSFSKLCEKVSLLNMTFNGQN